MRWWFVLSCVFLFKSVSASWQGELILSLDNLLSSSAVAVSSVGDIYVLDGLNNTIKVFNHKAELINTINIASNSPSSLAMDMIIGDQKLFVTNTQNHQILIFNLSGKLEDKISLPENESNQKPAHPVGISYQQDTLYWSDRNNHRVCKTALSDHKTICWGEKGSAENQFQYPFMIASDADDYLYVVDALNARIQVFNYRGKAFGTLSGFGLQGGALFRPNGIASDKQGNLFITDHYLGIVSSFNQRHFSGYLVDQLGEKIIFDQPVGISFFKDKLYIAEMGKSRVQVYQLRPSSKAQAQVAASQNKQQNCTICHIQWLDNNKPTPDSTMVPSVADEKMCMSCHHGAVIDSRQWMLQGSSHPDYHHPLEDGDFINNHTRKPQMDESIPLLVDNATPYCGSCHTPHTQHKEETGIHADHNNSWMREDNQQGKLCKSCHSEHYKQNPNNQRSTHHPIDIYLEKPDTKGQVGYTSITHLQQGMPETLKNAGAKVDDNKLICESCHLVHGSNDKQLLVLEQGKLCAQCHEKEHATDKKDARKKGIHPVNILLDEPLQFNNKNITSISCQTCHTMHKGKSENAVLVRESANAMCQDCHNEYSEKWLHPTDKKLDKAVSIAGQEINKMDCLSCHSVHEGQPNTQALHQAHTQGQLCENCHQDQQAVEYSDHNLLITNRDSKNLHDQLPDQAGLCGSCHSMHQVPKGNRALFIGADVSSLSEEHNLRDQGCIACHQENAIASDKALEHYSHPSRDLVMVSDVNEFPLVNNQGELKQTGVIACITCHSPHRWEVKDDKPITTFTENQQGTVLNSFLHHQSPTNSFCSDCHGIETLIRYKYYHDSRSRPGFADYLK